MLGRSAPKGVVGGLTRSCDRFVQAQPRLGGYAPGSHPVDTTDSPEQEPRPSPGTSLRWRLVLVLTVLVSSVACDRVTKLYAQESLANAGRYSFLADTVRIEYALNTGAFLSLGARLPELARNVLLRFGVAAIVVATLAAALTGRRRTRVEVAALALVASGGLGNLWDRFERGAVVDFMNLGIGPVRTGIFNVADLAIVAGVVMLVLGSREQKSKPAAPSGEANPP